jgi:hypothetical protein
MKILKEKILFNKEECNSIIWNGGEKITNWDKKDRKYQSQSILYSDETRWIFERLKSFFENETGIKIINLKETIHFHKFSVGDWFDLHDDTRDRRLFSVGVLLNDDFEGGDFILYNPNEHILNKKIGNTYIFDARIEHEITQILSNTRYSLLWFLQKEHLKIETNKLI